MRGFLRTCLFKSELKNLAANVFKAANEEITAVRHELQSQTGIFKDKFDKLTNNFSNQHDLLSRFFEKSLGELDDKTRVSFDKLNHFSIQLAEQVKTYIDVYQNSIICVEEQIFKLSDFVKVENKKIKRQFDKKIDHFSKESKNDVFTVYEFIEKVESRNLEKFEAYNLSNKHVLNVIVEKTHFLMNDFANQLENYVHKMSDFEKKVSENFLFLNIFNEKNINKINEIEFLMNQKIYELKTQNIDFFSLFKSSQIQIFAQIHFNTSTLKNDFFIETSKNKALFNQHDININTISTGLIELKSNVLKMNESLEKKGNELFFKNSTNITKIEAYNEKLNISQKSIGGLFIKTAKLFMLKFNHISSKLENMTDNLQVVENLTIEKSKSEEKVIFPPKNFEESFIKNCISEKTNQIEKLVEQKLEIFNLEITKIVKNLQLKYDKIDNSKQHFSVKSSKIDNFEEQEINLIESHFSQNEEITQNEEIIQNEEKNVQNNNFDVKMKELKNTFMDFKNEILKKLQERSVEIELVTMNSKFERKINDLNSLIVDDILGNHIETIKDKLMDLTEDIQKCQMMEKSGLFDKNNLESSNVYIQIQDKLMHEIEHNRSELEELISIQNEQIGQILHRLGIVEEERINFESE